MVSGYDLSSKVPFRLMQGRLGVYNKDLFQKESIPVEGVHNHFARMGQ